MTNTVFFHGIKGVGMTALACAMQDQDWLVKGSDTKESFITDSLLVKRGIEVLPLDSPVPNEAKLVIYSAAYSPPTTSARVLSLAEALAEFVQNRQVIAVAGVGGKTTTSAMLACLMQAAGRDIGYYIGTSRVNGLKAPGSAGSDPYFVVEADEYAISKTDPRPKFALLSPRILVTTNLLHDHPDLYKDQSATLAAYSNLVSRLKPESAWICSAADPLTMRIRSTQAVNNHLRIIPYGPDHPLFSKLKLSVFGDHNRLDALAAVLAALEAGLSKREALAAITLYQGAKRRQEKLGESRGRLFYDDYGHHPEEIKATIQAFRREFPKRRLVLVFESHTYSRTEALLSEFAHALSGADLVFIMPIFESAREKNQPHRLTTAAFASHIPGAVELTWDNAAQEVAKASRPGDLVLTMGAGFVYKLSMQIRAILGP